ncbi:MAG: hypothetical protein HY073_00205 [Deltaproteobacteria bacterium]|nr:hypothetical protein [Deltaproteobacteria bacterium]
MSTMPMNPTPRYPLPIPNNCPFPIQRPPAQPIQPTQSPLPTVPTAPPLPHILPIPTFPIAPSLTPPPPRKTTGFGPLALALFVGFNCGGGGRARTDAGYGLPPGCSLLYVAGVDGSVRYCPDAGPDARRDALSADRSADATPPDAMAPDAAVAPDAGSPEAGTPDAGVPSDGLAADGR